MRDYLSQLESESIYIFREIYGQFKKPVLLFSGGKDSTLLIHLARKALFPIAAPFDLLHIDTGYNFKEALNFRDDLAKKYGFNLIIRKVENTIKQRNLEDSIGKYPSRNALQSVTLIDAINEFGFDVCIGGGRRDEEKARAKERIFSIREKNGAWKPYNQRPELWKLYNGKVNKHENVRAFPISNWSEMDVWNYILKENIKLPSLYFAHNRDCINNSGKLIAVSDFINLDENDIIETKRVRYRTVGDMTCTAAVESEAQTMEQVIAEIESSILSERGETRIDDQFSDAAMEDRKMQGYF